MAVPGNFFELTLPDYLKGISDAIIQDNVLLAFLKSKGRLTFNKGGDGYEFRVRVSKANIGGSATDWDAGRGKTISTVRHCSAKFRPYLWRLVLNDLQADRQRYAPESSKIADEQEEDLNEIKQEATERIGVHAYGDGATLSTGDAASSIPIEGLESLIAATGTYFGLSRTTYTALNSQVVACANPSLWDDGLVNNLIKALDTLMLSCAVGAQPESGISPAVATKKETLDILITTATLHKVFREALMPQHQYVGDTANPMKRLQYGEAEVAWDSFCTASRVYGLNASKLEMRVVGPQIVRLIKTVEKSQPVVKEFVLGGQMQMHSKDPRVLGKITVTGT